MRQQQQKTRNRNRGRKSSNPLSRNFESNGPSGKIRGNASHIAEKYSMFARDAFTNDDTVMAENYFQHAEHYFRIVAATQQNHVPSGGAEDEQRESGNIRVDELSDSTSGDDCGAGPQPGMGDIPVEATLKEEGSVIKESRIEKPDNVQLKGEQSRIRHSERRATTSRKVSYKSSRKDDGSTSFKTSSTSDENKPQQQKKQLSERITSRPNRDENLSLLDEE